MNILITGAAGFIGFHLSNLFLNQNHKIIGIDNLCKSYGVKYFEGALLKNKIPSIYLDIDRFYHP